MPVIKKGLIIWDKLDSDFYPEYYFDSECSVIYRGVSDNIRHVRIKKQLWNGIEPMSEVFVED